MKTVVKRVGIALAALGLLFAFLLVAFWAPDVPVEELKARWAPPPSQFLEVGDLAVHLRDEGPRDDPAPLLLLHGTSASLHTWEGWAEALKGERRVIRVDLPGFGLTGPTVDGDYTIDAYVRFVIGVLDTLDVPQTVLGGNSFGGHVAWETAVAHPERVAALILVDAGGYPFRSESMPIGFQIARTPVLRRIMEVTLPRSMVESSVRNVYGDPSKVTPELVDRYYDLTLREGNRTALVERFRQVPSGDPESRIRTITAPTLILWGAEDRLVPGDCAERFHRDIAGSERVVFEGLGHVPHEEDPSTTVAVVRTFLGLEER